MCRSQNASSSCFEFEMSLLGPVRRSIALDYVRPTLALKIRPYVLPWKIKNLFDDKYRLGGASDVSQRPRTAQLKNNAGPEKAKNASRNNKNGGVGGAAPPPISSREPIKKNRRPKMGSRRPKMGLNSSERTLRNTENSPKCFLIRLPSPPAPEIVPRWPAREARRREKPRGTPVAPTHEGSHKGTGRYTARTTAARTAAT